MPSQPQQQQQPLAPHNSNMNTFQQQQMYHQQQQQQGLQVRLPMMDQQQQQQQMNHQQQQRQQQQMNTNSAGAPAPPIYISTNPAANANGHLSYPTANSSAFGTPNSTRSPLMASPINNNINNNNNNNTMIMNANHTYQAVNNNQQRPPQGMMQQQQQQQQQANHYANPYQMQQQQHAQMQQPMPMNAMALQQQQQYQQQQQQMRGVTAPYQQQQQQQVVSTMPSAQPPLQRSTPPSPSSANQQQAQQQQQPLSQEQLLLQQQQQLHFQKQLAATFLAPSDSTKTKVHIATEYTARYYTHYLLTGTNGKLPNGASVGGGDDDDATNDTADASNGKGNNTFINDHTRARQRKMSVERDFNIIDVIGCGAFGEVFLCSLKSDPMNTLLVMKKLRKTVTMCRKQVMNVRAERDILVGARDGAEEGNGNSKQQAAAGQSSSAAASSAAKGERLSSPSPVPLPGLDLRDWAVSLYYSFQDDDNLYFVLEYCAGGDLMTWLMDLDIFSEHIAKFYLAEIVLAVEALHRKGFAHRDIKPDNILIDGNGHVKLTDFGLAKRFTASSSAGGAATAAGATSNSSAKPHPSSDRHGDGTTPNRGTVAAQSNGGNGSHRKLTKEERVAIRRAEKEAKQAKAWSNAMRENEGVDEDDDTDDDEDEIIGGGDFGELEDHQQRQQGNGAPPARSRGTFFTAVGSPGYMAPEVVIAKPSLRHHLRIDHQPVEPYSESSDWWSVGIILYEMLYGYVPFHTDEESSVQIKIVNWPRYLEFPGHDPRAKEPPPPRLPSRSAIDLMRRMLCAPEHRITFAEIIAHPFFAGINWETIRDERPKPILGYSATNPKERIVTGYEAPPFVLTLKGPTDTRYFDLAGVKKQQREQHKLHIQYKEAYEAKLAQMKRQQLIQQQKLQSAAAAAVASHSHAKSIAAYNASFAAEMSSMLSQSNIMTAANNASPMNDVNGPYAAASPLLNGTQNQFNNNNVSTPLVNASPSASSANGAIVNTSNNLFNMSTIGGSGGSASSTLLSLQQQQLLLQEKERQHMQTATEMTQHAKHLHAQQQAAINDLVQHSKAAVNDEIYQPSDKKYLFYGFTAKLGGVAGGGGDDGAPLSRAAQREKDMRDVMTGGTSGGIVGGGGTTTMNALKNNAKMARPALVQEFAEDDDD